MNQFFINLKKNRHIIVYIMLIITIFVGLHYRLFFAYNVNFTNLHQGTEFGHDEFNYQEMAANIVNKHIYGYMSDGTPNAYVTPGYPLFLAMIYSIFGIGPKSVLYIKIIQAILSTISIFLVFLIGKRISNKYVGLIAAIFIAIYPPLILYSRFLLTETLYTFLFLLYFLVQLIAMEKEKLIWHFVAGLLIASAILVRPLIFILMPLPYIYKYFTVKSDRGKITKQFGILALGFITLMLPWWIRNIITIHKFIFLCTQCNPFYYGIIHNYSELPPSSNETYDGIKLIIHNLMTNPIDTIKWYTIGKLNIICGSQDYWLQNNQVYLSSLSMWHYIIMITGAIGITMSIFKSEIRLISIFIILNMGVQLLFIPVPRYAVPIVPLISICGAYMLWYLFKQCTTT